MKATEIKIGRIYEIKAGRNAMKAKVIAFDARNGSWTVETANGKSVNIKDPARFTKEIVTEKPKAAKEPKPRKETVERKKGGKPNGKLSGLDAAYEVLKNAGVAMNVRQILEAATQQELCDLKGATPHMTISAAMQRELCGKTDYADNGSFHVGIFGNS